MADAAERFLLVLTTAGSGEQAHTLASQLVERRLAACVNVVPGVCSYYRWKGEVEREEEKLLVIKTAERLLPALRAAIHELHTYELPEVIAVSIADGDADYLRWLASELRSDGPEAAPEVGK